MLKKTLILLVCLVLVLCVSGCNQNTEAEINLELDADEFAGTSDNYGTVAVTASKTALNPLTGELNMASDRVGLRPYAISVNNIYDSWPQYGLSQADYIVEMETEGGITRLMAMYSDTREVPLIGSVRSLRDQFMEAIFQLDPIMVHIGTSIIADKAIANHNFRTMDAKVIPSALWIDRDRYASGYAIEHCKFTSGQLIDNSLDLAKLKGDSIFQTVAFNFLSETEQAQLNSGSASAVKFNISNTYDGDFRFDSNSNKYLKWQFDKKQSDIGNNDTQLSFDNVFVLFSEFSTIEGTELVSVDFKTGGTGYYFSNGAYEQITWKKTDYANSFDFTNKNGQELQVNTGKTYLTIVRNTNADSMEITE